jgi:dTDP-4-dehydrorhamnose 3,5-epimerase-like enzyme
MNDDSRPRCPVSIRSLPFTEPPIPATGGRIKSNSGEMARIVNGETFSFAAYIEFLPGSRRPRGNHYHRQKVETLYIMTGVLQAVYLDLETNETQEEILHAGDLISVPPRCAHVYQPLEYSQALELAADPYDETDTVSYDMISRVKGSGWQIH